MAVVGGCWAVGDGECGRTGIMGASLWPVAGYREPAAQRAVFINKQNGGVNE